MRGGPVRLACLSALLGLLLCATAQAQPQAQPRIIGGHAASPGEYPAQGFLEFSTSKDSYLCGGSLVSNRYFLTAAHCATEEDATPLDATAFHVTLGKVDQGTFEATDRYDVVENQVESNFGYPNGDPENDAALLTLSRPAPPQLEPLRLMRPDESATLYATGKSATVIGWGLTEDDHLSDQLLETTVPMTSDAGCTTAWGSEFQPASMVCAGGGATDTCDGDSGGPLMVSDGSFLVLAGLTSWGDSKCAKPGVPGVYTRLGARALNKWVRDRVPMARAAVSDAAPQPGQAVSFTAAASSPQQHPVTYTDYAWSFGDGSATVHGFNPSHTYAAAGSYVARLTASTTGDDVARAKIRLNVAFPPPPAPPVVTPAPIVPQPGAAARPRARILASGRPLVRHGRFHIRVNFSADAPTGTAIIEVFRGKKKIGTAKTSVRRNGSKRVTVKLSKAGRKLLRRSKSKRLKVNVSVRVKRHVLQTHKLTIRR
jgi:trypsin